MRKITFLVVLLSSFFSFGQNKKVNTTVESRAPHDHASHGYVRCSTTEYEEMLRAKDPNRMNTEQFENWLAPLVAKIKADRASGKNVQAVYNIPVVIHIIHDGDCIGTGENITDAQAISQITVMNQDYRRMASTPGGANSTGLAVDCEINFVLAKRDPSGNPTTGIVRHQIVPYSNNVSDGSTGPDWETTADTETMKAATIWDPTKYLNMWTIRPGGLPLNSGGQQGLLGYAQFPTGSTLTGIPAGTTTANTDGVVAAFNAMGTLSADDGTFILNDVYNLGRTMTHEVGHWLGLRHIWGDNTTCPATNNSTTKDYCADTPAANTANYDCNLTANSCPSTPGNDMVQNYMDYTNDACMDTFTADQKTRMQTVMVNSPRRNTLNASNGSVAPSAGIYFANQVNKCSVTEGTNCSFTEVAYRVNIIKAPTQNAVVTFTVDAGTTATNNVDFQILTPTVTFPAGSTASQDLVIRYFNDGIQEASENIVIGMTVNANGGDATIIGSYAGTAVANENPSKLKISIVDNDVAPVLSSTTTVINETFDPSPTVVTAIKDLDGDGNNWGIGATANTIGFNTNFAFSRSWLSAGNQGLNPDNILYTPNSFTIPAGTSTLSFGIGTTQTGSFYQERYSVYLTTVNPSTLTTTTLNAVTPVINNAMLAGPAQRNTITANVSSYAGQTVYLVFRHHNTFDQNWIMLDDILISTSNSVLVQTLVNTPTQYQALVPGAGTFYAADAATGNIMLDGTANAFNYGCTAVSVTRDQATAGAAAVNYGSNTANNAKVMAKRFAITPTTNDAAGNVTVKFYFTEAEIAAWEAATGNLRSSLKVIKDGVATPYSGTIGAFGSNVTFQASFANGLQGVYYFGTDAALSVSSNQEVIEGITLYPNPSTDIVNISIPGNFENTKYTIYNNVGQVISSKLLSSLSDLSINVSGFSDGVYFVKLEKDGSHKTLRFIKN